MFVRTAVFTAAAVMSVPMLVLFSPAAGQVTGDFDDDGFDDLAIGIPGETVNGKAGAGAVAVIYGSNQRLKANGDQFWHQDLSNMQSAAAAGDAYGSTLAAGDFNNDGFDDLAIGVPNKRVNNRDGAGAVVVLLGSNNGLKKSGNHFIHLGAGGMPDSPEVDDHFGAALAVGDFNNDDNDDLAVACPNRDVGIIADAGMVFVIPGYEIGVNTFERQVIDQSPTAINDSPETDDHFGSAIAAGDFNNDGFDDIAIGVPDEEINGRAAAGAVHVLKGSVDLLSFEADRFWTQDVDDILDATEVGDRFGAALAVGSFDGNAFEDLAIGVPGEDLGATEDAGVVHVLYGRAAGLTAQDSQFWASGNPGLGNGAQEGDMLGAALAVGNFNGDNRDDLAIGAPGESIGARNACGAVIVLRGTANAGLVITGAQFWHQNVPDVLDANENNDAFGSSLGAGDFNGDGRDDLAVGVPFENIASRADAGIVQVFYGTPALLSAANDELWHQNVAGINGACGTDDLFGGANGE
jgi:hypothetical protein